jgi:diguanylate cyclase (GGDEF)-like protein/hemerythrin-like metal-binding protein
MMKWNDNLSIGVKSLDKEHEKLLNIINQISTIANNSDLQVQAELLSILSKLIKALEEHTINEKTILKECNYKDLDKQVTYHNNIMHSVSTIKINILNSDTPINIQTLHETLLELMLTHIVIECMPLFDVFQKNKQIKNKSLIKRFVLKTVEMFSFTKRMLIYLLIPLIGMLIFGLIILWDNYNKHKEMKTTFEISHILKHINEFAHNMQIERGLSSGYLTSEGTKFKSKLKKQHVISDESIKLFNLKIKTTNTNKLVTIKPYLKSFKEDIDSLKDLRQMIIEKKISQLIMIDFYSNTIKNILNITSKIAHLNHDTDISSSILSLSSLSQFKESLGSERAYNIMFIEQKNISLNEYIKFIELLTVQKKFLTAFGQTASNAQMKLKNSFINSSILSEINIYRGNIKNKNFQNLDSEVWFSNITKYINTIKVFEEQLLKEINTLLSDEIDKTFNDFILWFVYSIFITVLIVLTIYTFERNSKKQTYQLTDAMKHLANGGRNLRLSIDTIDNKMAQMCDAYEITRQKLLIGDIYTQLFKDQKEAELKKQQSQNTILKEIAFVDSLTGVINRRKFQELSEKELTRSNRYKSSLSFLMLDIDYFKKINDTYGHDAGDEVLKHFSSICLDIARESDVVSRIGGEEFIIMLPVTDENGAYLLAERLRKKVFNSSIKVNNKTIKYSVSIGIGILTDKDKNVKEVLKRVDEALYKAKNSGRNTTAIYKSDIT